MAKKAKTTAIPSELTGEQQKTKDLLQEIRDRYKKCVELDKDNRDAYRKDMKFIHVPGEQWDEQVRIDRGNDRPMYEFNRLRVTIKNVVNSMRANRPQAKIRATEDGDKDTAEVYEGLTKNIWNASDADSVVDYAAEHQVGGGFGAWRVTTSYAEDSVDQQDIKIEAILNPLCLYPYGSTEQLHRDALAWFLHTKLKKEVYEARYPNKEVASFEPDEELEEDEEDNESVWVAEYWKKVPVKKTLCLLSNGMTVEKGKSEYPEGVTVVKERTFDSHKIVQYIVSRDAILEGPNDWAGSKFPFIIVYGDYVVIDGKVQWSGLARYGKDAQRAHNWAMTSMFESIAAAPAAKYWVTPAQAEGNTGHWTESHKKNYFFNIYNPDPTAPGPPARVGGAEVPAALVQASLMSGDELKAVTGKFDASLGNQSNETSGKAIIARQNEGNVATYNFNDNMTKAIGLTLEIEIDLLPKIYDTQRSIRILGKDGAEKYIKVNAIDPATGQVLNDLSRGKYDMTVTPGPSYATQRMEAAEIYMGMIQANPGLLPIAGDLFMKALDLPYSDALAERLLAVAPPQIQKLTSGDAGKDPQVMAAMQQAEQAMQAVQQQGQLVQQAAQEAQGEKATADKAKSDVQIAIANLKVQEANLAKDVADFKTLVAQTQAKMATDQAGQNSDTERQNLGADVKEALAAIQQTSAELFQQYAQQLMQLHAQTQPQVVVANPPKQKLARTKRINGELVTTIEEVPQAVQ